MMATTVKNKIRAGTVFLFLLLLLSGGLGIYYVVKLKNDAQVILKNNYESLEYSHAMQQALDSLPINRSAALKNFETELLFQEKNITEPGEKEATAIIRKNFQLLNNGNTSPLTIRTIQQQLQSILLLNMSAIEVKNKKASTTADSALAYLSAIAALIFIVAITFAYNFPAIVTDPIKKLTEAIQQIADKNYQHRINLDRKDEFGKMADAYNSMAERLEYFESSNLNKLLFEKSRAEAVINSLKDASIGIDKKDTVLFANGQALQLLGLSAEAIVGKSIQEVSKKNDLFRFLMEEKSTAPFKIVIENRENYFIKESIEVSPKEGTGNKVIILKNITPFKEMDVAKTNFLATISHELKTPLASSDFGLKLLQDERVGHLSEEQRNLVKHLEEDNQRMLKILSELLNMSQVEAGKMELIMKPVDPSTLIESAIASVQTSADEKKITIEQNVASGLPPVMADIDKTGWVLNNFLTNAIKFSSSNNSITISAIPGDRKVIFSVTDHGIGIQEEYQKKIFDRYYKVPGSIAPGTGLGLAISKEFIEAMKGRIWVNSIIGGGSVFSFEIPAA